MKYSASKILLGAFAAALLVPLGDAFAQRHVTPADTGRMKWGHEDFKDYFNPGMCDRAMADVMRQYQRVFKPDTSTSRLAQTDSVIREIPQEVIETAKKCAPSFNISNIEPSQLPSMARIYVALGDIANSQVAMDKAVSLAKDKADTIAYLSEAVLMYMNAIPVRLDVAKKYADIIENGGINDMPAKFWVKTAYMSFYHNRYIVDSTKKYAREAIDLYKNMTIEDQDKSAIPNPFNLRIELANETGDLPLQSSIVDTAAMVMSGWRSGQGSQFVRFASNAVDLRKTFYNKKTKPLEEGMWQNHNGIPRPQAGKVSLLVQTSHNCGMRCYGQISTIRKLHRTYGSDIDISIITTTNGFAPGSGPLEPAEEAKAAAKYFNDFLKLPFPVLVDEAPTHKLDDGRIRRGSGPIATMFGDFQGINAILTDASGRIQWMGGLSSENDRKLVMAAINRALAMTDSASTDK